MFIEMVNHIKWCLAETRKLKIYTNGYDHVLNFDINYDKICMFFPLPSLHLLGPLHRPMNR